MAITVDVYGSCVSRDLFRYVSPGKYEFKRCVTQIPISTLYEKAVRFHEENIQEMNMTEYEKTLFKIQTQKLLPQILKKNKSDILVIDLADELMERCQIKGKTSGQIAQMPGKEDQYEQLLKKEREYTIVDRFHPIQQEQKLLEKKYRKFTSEILYGSTNPDGYKPEQIVIIEAIYASDILGNDGRLHKHDSRYNIGESNEWLEKLYEMLYRFLPGCQMIKLPRFLHSSENHIHGLHPLHYMSDTYYYMERALDVVNGYSNVNTLENLRNEQSLLNRLQTRTVNELAIFELKKQIHELQNKLKNI